MTTRSPSGSVLFVCVHNAGRSQMAAAWCTELSGGRVRGISAGTRPAATVHPAVLTTMSEVGIDLRAVTPRLLTVEIAQGTRRVVTMGCAVEDACPAVHADEDWGLLDVATMPIASVRRIRDEIRHCVTVLLRTLPDA